jgi:TfoX/Sxy family transcriptional regulator of competence genes
MAYDETLAKRVRGVLKRRRGVTEKRMFGGLAFMVNGNMACGVLGADLMVRVGPERYEAALKKAGARPMDFTGRPMKGMVYVGPRGTRAKPSLEAWVAHGVSYARSLPAK